MSSKDFERRVKVRSAEKIFNCGILCASRWTHEEGRRAVGEIIDGDHKWVVGWGWRKKTWTWSFISWVCLLKYSISPVVSAFIVISVMLNI